MHRSLYAYNLKKIILKCHQFPKSNDNESYVIGINAPWGTGKTYFVKMFQNYLQGKWEDEKLSANDRKCAIEYTGEMKRECNEIVDTIYYDAWANDFWDNAFEPLFDKLTQTEQVYLEAEKEDLIDFGKSIGKIIALTLKGIAYKRVEEMIDTSALDDIIDEIKKSGTNLYSEDFQTSELFPEYSAFKNAIVTLRYYLQQTVEHHNGRLVIVIDELDRCKPTFAVQTLEIIKHIFNINGLIFILSLDMSQLSHCVKSVYGDGIDAEGYLERFFNYLTILPQTNIERFADCYFQEFGINILDESEKSAIKKIVKDYSLSLREFRMVLCSYFVLTKTVLEEYKNIPNARILYFYFLTIKYKHPNIFMEAVFQNRRDQIMKLLESSPIPYTENYIEINKQIIAVLCSSKRIDEQDFQIIQQNRCVGVKRIKNCTEDVIRFTDGTAEHIQDGFSLSGILFRPDLQQYKSIKAYNPIEYIYRKLEMCDFCEEA